MKRSLAACLTTLAVLVAVPSFASQGGTAAYADDLKQLFDLRDRVRDVHPALATLHPVAVAEDGKLLVFSPDEARRVFALTATVPQPFPIPKGIRAAFPLDALGGKAVCVVTPDVFDQPDGLTVVFHEFVHCEQWTTCETRLKEKLGIYRKALAEENVMWEIQHPFPYADGSFQAAYGRMLAAIDARDGAAVAAARAELGRVLKSDDREYMVWQEWKEGLARFVENGIRARLGQPQNTGGTPPPFSRVTFYAGGARLAAWIIGSDPSATDMEKLFERISSLGSGR